MKITNTRSEDSVERTTNNDLTEDDKNKLIKIFEPKNINITHHLKQLRNKANGQETNTVQMKNTD